MMGSFYKLVGVSCLFFLFVQHESAAHSPHHVITEIAVSPGDEAQSEVFILVTDQIFKSDHNGLSWKILENGLTNQFPFTSLEFHLAMSWTARYSQVRLGTACFGREIEATPGRVSIPGY